MLRNLALRILRLSRPPEPKPEEDLSHLSPMEREMRKIAEEEPYLTPMARIVTAAARVAAREEDAKWAEIYGEP